ncbi:hypothetical protein Aduo_015494 [Ancylostoma duodenale]
MSIVSDSDATVGASGAADQPMTVEENTRPEPLEDWDLIGVGHCQEVPEPIMARWPHQPAGSRTWSSATAVRTTPSPAYIANVARGVRKAATKSETMEKKEINDEKPPKLA